MPEIPATEKPLPLFRRTHHSTLSRENEGNSRYAMLDIEDKQNERLKETEYRSIIDEGVTILSKERKQDLKCLELACGSAPWAKHLSQKGFNVECSDYSKVIVERLEKEQGLHAFVAQINNLIEIPDNTYDLIVMSGGIYEDPNPYYAVDVYREVSRILKPGGIYIQFCNRFLNFSNKILYFRQRIRTAIGDFIYSRLFNNIRKFFRYRIEAKEKTILLWLLPLNLLEVFALDSNMRLVSRHYIQHEVGLAEVLFFLPRFKRFDLYSDETAFTDKDKIFRKWFNFLANKIRKRRNKHICRSAALVFKNQS
jgi:SAM-dependent methyltransferase